MRSADLQDKYAEGNHFFTRLFGGKTYSVAHPPYMFENTESDAPDFDFSESCESITDSKVLQRLYFNANAVLAEYIPDIVILSKDDVLDNVAMQSLLAGICSKPFVVKRDHSNQGNGNTFSPRVKSIAQLRALLLPIFDANEKETGSFFESGAPIFQYILIESQMTVAPTPGKYHHGVYRAVCVLSDQEDFIAQITTRHELALTTPDSHKARCSYFWGGQVPYCMATEYGRPVGAALDSPQAKAKAQRYHDLEDSKSKLFKQLKEMTVQVAAFSYDALSGYTSVPSTTLSFGKISFLSHFTKWNVIDAAKALTARIDPPKTGDFPRVDFTPKPQGQQNRFRKS